MKRSIAKNRILIWGEQNNIPHLPVILLTFGRCYICKQATCRMIFSAQRYDPEQRRLAISRLTALWAFAESGLGGVLHALQVPFTGLIVGGMAVILLICIAQLAANNLGQLFKSLIVVLIVKAMVSPLTPFPAYVAVTFQAVVAWCLFRSVGIHLISMIVLGVLAMLESAVQKIIILTLFFGRSLWKAVDEWMQTISSQLHLPFQASGQWLVGTYLFIYVMAGLIVGIIAYRIIKTDEADQDVLVMWPDRIATAVPATRRRSRYRPLVFLTILLLMALTLYWIAPDAKQGWSAVLRTIIWTSCMIGCWYLIIGPVMTRLIMQVLHKQEHRYSDEVAATLSFMPVLRQLSGWAWQQSKMKKGPGRYPLFLSLLIQATLLWKDPLPVDPITSPAT